MLMAKLFQELKRHNKFPFELVFLVMDPGYSEVNRKLIENNARIMGVPITVFESQIFEAVYDIQKSPCYLCARMRRGHLYNKAKELGCNKIALGHHYDAVSYTHLDVYKRQGYTIHYGVDVSSWQEDIDWAKAKADGVEFAIIRAGYRGWGSAGNPGKDPYLIKNIEGAQAQGIRVGVYIYSQAITPDEARQEVDWVIGWLQGHQIDLPMVLDYEYAESYGALTGRLYNANLSRQAATDVCLAFCEYARDVYKRQVSGQSPCFRMQEYL